MSETSKYYRSARPDMLSSFLPSGIPSVVQWEVASKYVQKWAHLQPPWQKSNFTFRERDSVGRLWTITHPPLFQSLSSPAPLGVISKDREEAFPSLYLHCFLLPGTDGAGVCMLGTAMVCPCHQAVQWHKPSLPGPMVSAQLPLPRHGHYFNSCG